MRGRPLPIHRPAILETARLRLVVLVPEEIRALIAGDVARAGAGVRASGVRAIFPPGWPDNAEAREGLPWHLRHLEASDDQLPWRVRVMVERSSNRVVGAVNLKGPPDPAGDVEIGWGTVEERRRHGFAFEASHEVMGWAARQPGVRSLSATVPEENLPSQRLAAKLGMELTGDLRGSLPLWRRIYWGEAP